MIFKFSDWLTLIISGGTDIFGQFFRFSFVNRLKNSNGTIGNDDSILFLLLLLFLPSMGGKLKKVP